MGALVLHSEALLFDTCIGWTWATHDFLDSLQWAFYERYTNAHRSTSTDKEVALRTAECFFGGWEHFLGDKVLVSFFLFSFFLSFFF